MATTTFVSCIFDDPDAAAADLLSALPQQAAGAALGVLFCNSQTDYVRIYEKTAERAGFPVVGGTALGFPFSDAGDNEISAALLVLQKDGLEFAIAVSQPLEQGKHSEQMRDAFERCRASLGGEPKLVMPFFPLKPGLLTGLFIDDILSLAGDAPVFGGTATNDLISTRPAVFADGETHSDRMVLVMLGGDVRPALAVSNRVTPVVEYAPIVTASMGNEVFQVDGTPYCEYMRDVGISPEDRINGVDALMQYGPTPVVLDSPDAPESDVPDVRCISFTNLEKGSATFSGPVPEGAKLRISILRKQDVDDSTLDCIAKLRRRMEAAEKDGYAYSALFCVSCVARYFVLVGDRNTERDLLRQEAPEGLAPVGLYAFCEIGPAYAACDNSLINRSHSASIALCAI